MSRQLLSLLFLIGLGASSAAAPDTPSVRIVEPPFQLPQTWHYEAAELTVKVGTTVTWSNTGAVAHTVTADDGRAFDSKTMAPRARFSFTPRQAGRFTYHCSLHPWMKATLIVTP